MVDPASGPPPTPTFRGPEYLHGTVGSLVRVRGYRPLLVSGYGLVVGLPGTGSADVPAFLREWMLNEMRKRGLGSDKLGTESLSPERVLASQNTAIVRVAGLVPRGATKGTRFDVMVEALEQTQTTNLQGGRLWTTSLGVRGANRNLNFTRERARARGPIYVNPAARAGDTEGALGFQRRALILAGGKATHDRRLAFTLNQPSWTRSRLIANRINVRFGRPGDRPKLASPKTDRLIRLNLPPRYGDEPGRLLELIRHLYVQRGKNFAPRQARQLAASLRAAPERADRVVPAWVALGKTVLQVLRPLYEAEQRPLRFAAAEAGARLGDALAAQPLSKLARSESTAERKRAARALRFLPDTVDATDVLRRLVDDPAPAVRIAAADALAASGDPAVRRHVIRGGGRIKFVLDLVKAERPLISVRQSGIPRITVFDPNTPIRAPIFAKLWNNRLMLRSEKQKNGADVVTVFYQPRGADEPETHPIAPAVANLIRLLGRQPTAGAETPGLDLSYSRVVNAVYRLSVAGDVPGEIELRRTELAEAIEKARERESPATRPEIGSRSREGRPVEAAPGAGNNARQADAPRPQGSGAGG